MPNIGHRETVTAFTLDAEARGGANPTTDSDSKEYEPPAGYIIINFKENRQVDRGDATASIGTAPAGHRIINTDDISGSLNSHVEWRYAQVWGTGDLDAKWKNIRKQIEEYQILNRRIVGNARAKGERFGAGAHIRITVEAVIEYVGTANDAQQYANKLFSLISLPKILHFSAQWRGINNEIIIENKFASNADWNYEVYVHTKNPNVKPHYIWFGLSGQKKVYSSLNRH